MPGRGTGLRFVEGVPAPGRVEPPDAPVLVGDLIACFEEGVGAEEQFDADRFTARRVERVALVLKFGVVVSPCRRTSR